MGLRIKKIWAVLCFAFAMGSIANAQEDLKKAPPAFSIDGQKSVFIDILSSHSRLRIDFSKRVAFVETVIDFYQAEDGYALFDLVPSLLTYEIDGTFSPGNKVLEVSDPDKVTLFRRLPEPTAQGKHQLRITHSLKASANLVFGASNVDFMNRMSDRNLDGNVFGRGYMERYFPSNMEWDDYPFELRIEIEGLKTPHRVISNGRVTRVSDLAYVIQFPEFFSSSSFFFHLLDPRFYNFETVKVVSEGHEVPLTFYSRDAGEVRSAAKLAPGYFAEIESNFGPYLFEKFVGHVTPAGGGMEYGGATDSSVWALSHEMFHSWYARGVRPRSGNSGWIDEGLARWRDNGYPRAKDEALKGLHEKLSGFSPYKRDTSIYAYDVGSVFFSKLDRLFAKHTSLDGLIPVLREFVQTYAYQSISTEMFQAFLQERISVDLQPYFDFYIYAKK